MAERRSYQPRQKVDAMNATISKENVSQFMEDSSAMPEPGKRGLFEKK
jgi:hypothetical protein